MPFLQEYLLLEPLNERFGFDLPETMDKVSSARGFIDLEMKYQTIDLTSPVELRRKQTFLLVQPLGGYCPTIYSRTQPISGYVNMTTI